MEAVHGRDVLIEIKKDGVYYPVLCGTDCTFTREPEFLESTNPTSGIFKRYIIRREDWNMGVNGLTKIENDASLTFFYLLQTSVRRATQTVRITFEDIDSNSIQIEGSVLIGNETISGPVSDFASCSIEFKGMGRLSLARLHRQHLVNLTGYLIIGVRLTGIIMLTLRAQVLFMLIISVLTMNCWRLMLRVLSLTLSHREHRATGSVN